MAGTSEGLGNIGAAAAVIDDDRSVVPWEDRIKRSIDTSRQVRGGNYVQIATVDEDGAPRCRTVVFRGFLAVDERGGAKAMRMITDARSEKVGAGFI